MPPKNTRKAIVPVGPSTAYLPLTKGQYALVDIWHVNGLEQYCWHASYHHKNKQYRASASFKITKTRVYRVAMHRAIAGGESFAVDHRNGNPLDNREANLRQCTSAENNRNRRKIINKTGLKGVNHQGNRHLVVVNAPLAGTKKSKYIGCFKTAEEAARAYDRWAIANYGEFAATNFPLHEYPAQGTCGPEILSNQVTE